MFRKIKQYLAGKKFSQVFESKFWYVAFWTTMFLRRGVEWLALWVEFLNARCAFRCIGNEKFCNKRHTLVRYETPDQP